VGLHMLITASFPSLSLSPFLVFPRTVPVPWQEFIGLSVLCPVLFLPVFENRNRYFPRSFLPLFPFPFSAVLIPPPSFPSRGFFDVKRWDLPLPPHLPCSYLARPTADKRQAWPRLPNLFPRARSRITLVSPRVTPRLHWPQRRVPSSCVNQVTGYPLFLTPDLVVEASLEGIL